MDSTYKPGDPPPGGYLNWHAWAEVQGKAGLRQKRCSLCGRWKFPQELNGTVCLMCAPGVQASDAERIAQQPPMTGNRES